jgi:adenosylmethionine-8-amino-7-oxononanoate aminotransferase
MARQTRSGVAGISMWLTPSSASASTIALMTAASALKVFERTMEDGMLFRSTGDIIAMAPPFISTKAEIEIMVETLRAAIRAVV